MYKINCYNFFFNKTFNVYKMSLSEADDSHLLHMILWKIKCRKHDQQHILHIYIWCINTICELFSLLFLVLYKLEPVDGYHLINLCWSDEMILWGTFSWIPTDGMKYADFLWTYLKWTQWLHSWINVKTDYISILASVLAILAIF